MLSIIESLEKLKFVCFVFLCGQGHFTRSCAYGVRHRESVKLNLEKLTAAFQAEALTECLRKIVLIKEVCLDSEYKRKTIYIKFNSTSVFGKTQPHLNDIMRLSYHSQNSGKN